VCGSFIRPDMMGQLTGIRPVGTRPVFQDTEHWTIQDWTRWIEIIKYLLSKDVNPSPLLFQAL
jgi:hypothetical protein